MPLYGWLPDAHAMAPHAISAVLSGVLIKTPLFALSRVLLLVPAGTAAGELMGYAGALTALVAVIIALSQKDAKRLLAYHSISQIGYVVAAWGAAIRVGLSTRSGITLMTAAFLHAFFHALFKGLLFLSVGTTVDRTGERDVYRLRGAARILRRTGERFPVTLLSFAVGALSISAIPPLNGFISKTAVSSALKDNPLHSLLYAAGIATVASFVKLSRIYWPKKDAGSTDETAAGSGRTTPAIWIPQIFLAALCVAGGVAVRPVYTLVFRIFSRNSGIALRIPEFYSSGNLGKALLVTAAGVLLFLLATTARGSLVMARIRNRPRSFQGLFTSFALGTAAMAAWLLI